jgi:hypothetical protein
MTGTPPLPFPTSFEAPPLPLDEPPLPFEEPPVPLDEPPLPFEEPPLPLDEPPLPVPFPPGAPPLAASACATPLPPQLAANTTRATVGHNERTNLADNPAVGVIESSSDSCRPPGPSMSPQRVLK